MKLFNKYKFSDKSQALGGLISTAMGILSLLSFGYGVYLSFKAAGEGGLRVGSLGILSLILAVIGTVIGCLFVGFMSNFFTLMSLSNGIKQLCNGGFIILAVMLGTARSHKKD